MSRRRPPPEELPADPLERDPDDWDPPLLLEDWLEELVEYFVEPLELCWVFTSVPNSAQSSQTSSSAPSTLIVFGEVVSFPHISHWTIVTRYP
jgi:hypothetical protein